MQLFAPKDTTKFNLIFSGSPVPAGLAKVMQDKLPWKSAAVKTLLLPSPITDITPLPRSTASERFVPPPVEQVCDRRRNKWLLDRTAACQSWICSPCCKSCVYGICAFVLRWVFFLFSHCTPQWSIVWGLKKNFLLSFLMQMLYFSYIPCLPVLSTPLSYVSCVCTDRLMANFAGTCY